MLGTAWSAVRAALVAAIFTFLDQLLKGLLEYRTAAAARTSMRRMIFKKVLELDAGDDFAFGCLFMPASAEQRVPWKNRGAQKRLINRKINKYMKINFTSFLVTEGLIYAAIVAALVGLSGCGKSTILRLLLRFYAPTEGEILINGIPLEKISFRELHQRITFLEQHPRRL